MNHLPDEITGAHPEIVWPQIRDLRNILVHQYFGVDIDVVRDVVILICLLLPRRCGATSLLTDGAAPKVIRLRNVVEFKFNVT